LATPAFPTIVLASDYGLENTVEASVAELAVKPNTSPGVVTVAQLDVKHIEWRMYNMTWIILQLLREGGDMLRQNAQLLLAPRPKEDPSVYNARIKRITYQNIIANAGGWYEAEMFKTAPRIEMQGDEYDNFLQDCDRTGRSLVDFYRTEYGDVFVNGRSYVLVDQPQGSAKTLQEERDLKLNEPYLTHFNPLEVINWKKDVNGNFEWVVIRIKIDRCEFLGSQKWATRWMYYDRENFRIYEHVGDPDAAGAYAQPKPDEKVALVSEGLHALAHVKKVPIHVFMLPNCRWMGKDAYLQLIDHFNQDNTYAWALFMSNLAMPVITGNVDASEIEFSEASFIVLPEGTKYEWSEPKGTSFTASENRVSQLREECYRQMYLMAQGRSSRATPAMQSGKSKEVDMVPARDVLSSHGDGIRASMNAVCRMVIEAKTRTILDPSDDAVTVNGFNFDVDMSTEEVFAASATVEVGIPSPTFERVMYKKMVRSWTADQPQEVVDTIFTEIDEGPLLEQRRFAQMEQEAKLKVKYPATSNGKTPGQGGVGGKGKPEGDKPSVQDT